MAFRLRPVFQVVTGLHLFKFTKIYIYRESKPRYILGIHFFTLFVVHTQLAIQYQNDKLTIVWSRC